MDRVRRSSFTSLLVATALVAPPALPADTDPVATPSALEPVVVVATRSERPLREVSGEITVVRRDQLEQRIATSFADAFRYTPGIDAEGGSVRFGTESINVRGIGGNRVAIELDGVPLPTGFRIGRFSNATRDLVDLGSVEQIEVLRGPASALYGSDALGGIVAVRTRDPRDIGRVDGDVDVAVDQAWDGADDSWHAGGQLAWSDGRYHVVAGAALRDGHQPDPATLDGPADRQDYRRESAFARLVTGDAGHEWRIDLYGRRTGADTDMQAALGSGRFRNTTVLSGHDESTLGLAAVSLTASPSWRFADTLSIRAHLTDSVVEQDSIDERGAAPRPVRIARTFRFTQRATGVDAILRRDVDVGAWSHRVSVGIERRATDLHELRDAVETGLDDGVSTNVVLSEVFPLRDFPNSVTTTTGVFAQDEMRRGDWTVIAGLRYDRYDLAPQPDAIWLADNPATRPIGIDVDEISPRIGLVRRIGEHSEWYLQYAHGFRAPPFEDANIGLYIPLFRYRAISNPGLEPETSDGMDLGLRYRANGLRLHAGVFAARYRNFIESRVPIGVDADGWLTFQSRNLNSARVAGAELGWQWTLPGNLDPFDVHGGLFWATGENRETGEDLKSLGPPQAVLGLSYDAPALPLTAELALTVTDRWDAPGDEAFDAPGYALVDLHLGLRSSPTLDWRLSVNNLFDRAAWRWADVRGLSDGDALLGTLGQPGRHVALKFGWRTAGF